MLARSKEISASFTSEHSPAALPDTANVSLRDAIIWIAFGEAPAPEELKGRMLWLSRDEPLQTARSSLWSELADGTLAASAIGVDGAPSIIGQHEWQFLLGRQLISLSMKIPPADGLYVTSAPIANSPRFTKATVKRSDVLRIWPPHFATATAGVGRPSIMAGLELELDKWIAGGRAVLVPAMNRHGQSGKTTLIAIARALELWAVQNGLKLSHEDAPQPSAIENRLRDKLREANKLL